jgi:hypothetical protein
MKIYAIETKGEKFYYATEREQMFAFRDIRDESYYTAYAETKMYTIDLDEIRTVLDAIPARGKTQKEKEEGI